MAGFGKKMLKTNKTATAKNTKGVINTDYGKVIIDNQVIARIAGLRAVECFGIIGMAALSKRDGIVKLLTRNSLTKGIIVKVTNGEIFIDFHVIVAFGVAIYAVTDNLVSNVKYVVENMTGFPVSGINVFVEGVRVID